MSANDPTLAPGTNLRELRCQAGISQQRLAELAHCSIGMVRLLENGYEPAASDVRARLAEALTTSIAKQAGHQTTIRETERV